jgi:GT2 family glycosyltransferase
LSNDHHPPGPAEPEPERSPENAQVLERLLATSRRENQQMRSTLTVALTALRAQLKLIERSAAWRYGHRTTQTLSRVRGRRTVTAGGVSAAIDRVDRMLGIVGAQPAGHDASAQIELPLEGAVMKAATRAEEILLGQKVRARLGAPPALGEAPPSVSIVVVSRSAQRTLALLERLIETQYPAIELILVDNASPKSEVFALAQGITEMTVAVQRLETPWTVASASNAGAARAQSDLLLFLGDSIRPVEPWWLQELVGTLRDGDNEIVGATFVWANSAPADAAAADRWMVAQRGIALDAGDGSLELRGLGEGEDVFGDGFGVVVPVVAVSRACLLISKDTFAALGKFDPGFEFGLEDVEFCIRSLTRGGGNAVGCSGRVIIAQAGSDDSFVAGQALLEANRTPSGRRLRELWGPEVRRHRLGGLLRGDPVWGPGPRVAMALSADDQSERDNRAAECLANAAAELGWSVSYLKDGDGTASHEEADIAVFLNEDWDARRLPSSAVACAWIRRDVERWLTRAWFDRYDVLLAGSEDSVGALQEATGRPVELLAPAAHCRESVRRLKRIIGEQNDRPSFCLKIGAPDWDQAQGGGDLHFAAGLGRALRRLGHRWRIDVRSEWEAPPSSEFDVVIHLLGRGVYRPVPGQFNVLWLISHPETFSDVMADGYDLICVASERFAESVRGRVAAPVRVLEQATDPRVFFPDPDPSLAHELVFVGNARGVQRKIFEDLLPTERDLAVWGTGWSGTAVEPYVQGESVPNEMLRKVYSSAAIVLCDHWPGMRAGGFRSNRLYDALACGSLVVCDRVAGLGASLGDAVLTYEDRAELVPLLERLLTDPTERERRTQDARVRILRGETFDDRARNLISWVRRQ